jgi:hypothetical protein
MVYAEITDATVGWRRGRESNLITVQMNHSYPTCISNQRGRTAPSAARRPHAPRGHGHAESLAGR